MKIYVIDVRRTPSGILKSHRHRPRGFDARIIETDAMIGIARRTVAGNFGIDLCISRKPRNPVTREHK